MSNKLLEAALDYARAGFPVLPLHSPEGDGCSCGRPSCKNTGKHPRTSHGLKDATTDEATIRDWWKKWPKANIGIVTGTKSGLVVIDVDPRHGGDMSLKRLENDHGQIPRSSVAHTGGGGTHLYLKHPGVHVRNRVGIAPGLDIRGDGGYVVAPPSKHPSGKKYEWPKGAKLGQSALPILPQWLQRPVVGPKPTKHNDAPGPIIEGARNATLTSLAGGMRRRGAKQDAILAALQKQNNERCTPPLPDYEIEGIANSVSKYPVADEQASGKSLRGKLFAVLGADVAFFHTPEKEAYITIRLEDHFETRRVQETAFKRWLAARFYELFETMPRAQTLHDILGVLEGIALYGSPEEHVHTRLAEHNGAIYLDLCDGTWRVVEITADGWKLISTPPIRFRRARGMEALPLPEPGGSVRDLRPFLNLATDGDFVLVVSWLVAALRPRGPYPVLVLQGEAGSAKSTTIKVLRALVDPNTSPLRSELRETRDLMIAATNAWCIAFDNVSYLTSRLSDNLCRLATGGGFSTRQLYTDDEEKLFDATRPLMLNGIDGVVTRGDLLDRSLITYLPVIPEEQRKSEKEVWRGFRLVQPKILGALLDAVSCGLRTVDSVRLPRLPRMADFAQWVVAAEHALEWPEGAFLRAYECNRASANTMALDASPIVGPLQKLADADGWTGTATELLKTLGLFARGLDEQRAWPKSAWALSGQLRRLAPNLRATGIDIRFDEKTAGSGSKRLIGISRASVTPKGFAKGYKGADGITRYPFPRLPA